MSETATSLRSWEKEWSTTNIFEKEKGNDENVARPWFSIHCILHTTQRKIIFHCVFDVFSQYIHSVLCEVRKDTSVTNKDLQGKSSFFPRWLEMTKIFKISSSNRACDSHACVWVCSKMHREWIQMQCIKYINVFLI